MIYRLRREAELIRACFVLAVTRRQVVKRVAREEKKNRWNLVLLVLRDLFSACGAHQIQKQAIREYLVESLYPLLGKQKETVAKRLAADCAEVPWKEQRNPLKGAREAEAYLITSRRIRYLQARVVEFAFADWYGLNMLPRQSEILGCYSDIAWLARGLMKSAGLSEKKGSLKNNDRQRLFVVLEPFVKGLELRRLHLEGLSNPGRIILASLVQKRRIGRLRRSGFSPDNLKSLYPDMLDLETLRIRQEAILNLRDNAFRLIETKTIGRKFENYLHLQTLTMGAPSRGSRKLSRYLTAVESRYSA
ncbi:MAG: hypothetical protein DRZ90_08140 [Spirochaetes bacterium]|nr:MAG: hypothetical protein DRZ90_08140 [Spirochaetota bacterium]